MLKILGNSTRTQDRIQSLPSKEAINNAITRSMLQADEALTSARYRCS